MKMHVYEILTSCNKVMLFMNYLVRIKLDPVVFTPGVTYNGADWITYGF